MTEKRRLTPYEIGIKIKTLLDDKTDTNQILETVGIKRAQLTTYKKIINNGRLEDLRTKSVRKVLAEEKRSEQSKRRQLEAREGQKPDAKLNEASSSTGTDAREGQKPDAKLNENAQSMISEIERDGQNDNENINLENFVGGQKKYFVKHHNHHHMSDKFFPKKF